MDAEIIYQDNISAMLLEKHGTLSRIRRANHINARYYFISNKVPNVQVQLEQCPTWDIKFVKLRDEIMDIQKWNEENSENIK